MDGEKALPNHVHIAMQTPAYIFIGLAEILISVTGLEYAYTKAPLTPESFVQSLYLLTKAYLWLYTSASVSAFITRCVFYWIFHHYGADEERMYDLYRDEPILTHGVADAEGGWQG
ncbi:Peptide transporter-like protein [Hapsidospora chrysogenum ATCC 11550]|uniref:Peptide transporter-like protein n=1 Tax=Hapsidospora chrysogenum (strain ATCC 11550 / CBS 779.69 / DSM 880 / IAM 14645 / JCM 23072 / IMI 49137) TaxID=857340 RepID=A0A086T4F3_HAPC1|nr:Peptide transporter-like protein [Hapsidospora chrysogenum ATCC 11550]